MRKTEEEQGAKLIRCCKAVLIGGVTAFVFCIAFLFLAAVGISQGMLDPGLRTRLTVVGCVFGSFFGGLLAVRISQVHGLPIGCLTGLTLFLLQLTFGLLFYDTMGFEHGGLGFLCSSLCGGCAAGILGIGKKGKPARKRRVR